MKALGVDPLHLFIARPRHRLLTFQQTLRLRGDAGRRPAALFGRHPVDGDESGGSAAQVPGMGGHGRFLALPTPQN